MQRNSEIYCNSHENLVHIAIYSIRIHNGRARIRVNVTRNSRYLMMHTKCGDELQSLLSILAYYIRWVHANWLSSLNTIRCFMMLGRALFECLWLSDRLAQNNFPSTSRWLLIVLHINRSNKLALILFSSSFPQSSLFLFLDINILFQNWNFYPFYYSLYRVCFSNFILALVRSI